MLQCNYISHVTARNVEKICKIWPDSIFKRSIVNYMKIRARDWWIMTIKMMRIVRIWADFIGVFSDSGYWSPAIISRNNLSAVGHFFTFLKNLIWPKFSNFYLFKSKKIMQIWMTYIKQNKWKNRLDCGQSIKFSNVRLSSYSSFAIKVLNTWNYSF